MANQVNHGEAEKEQEDTLHVALKLRDKARRHILHYCGEPGIVH